MDPHNQTKRALQQSKPVIKDKILKYEPCIKVLQSVGFVVDEKKDILFVPFVWVSRLTDARSVLGDCLRGLGDTEEIPLPPPTAHFNPYACNVSSAHNMPTNIKKVLQKGFQLDKTQEETMKKDIRRKEAEAERTFVPLCPEIFHASALGGPPAPPGSNEEANESVNELTSIMGMEALSHLKEALSSGPKFKNRERVELEAKQNQPVYSKSVIRLRFPDGVILQLNFRILDKVDDMLRIIPSVIIRGV
eukprot:GHVO01070251.1.p1 GENE.GHVO01070251.1~~GHVO01070251.1.p1  ORF type:complete len:248 (-),score=54.85 GHVO01070251.1:94-837(-)